MALSQQILFGQVMHKRLFPAVNQFLYRMYYLALPLSQLSNLSIPYNRSGLMSFHDSDHGRCDGSALEPWAREILHQYQIDKADGEIVLICLPRVLGYVFNPVSFWLCLDNNGGLRAVLCEVNNTFGERHTYLCAHNDQSVIEFDDVLHGEKVFHVSPFLIREGDYQFRFRYNGQQFTAHIDYYNNNEKQLVTSLHGTLEILDSTSRRRAFWSYPLVTIKTIALIHWQALKLVMKKISYIPRPKQQEKRLSSTRNLTKN